tara:strand:+ start:265 stop:600 length:336 start_codon:yes stop_codon:yes gene_type:complete
MEKWNLDKHKGSAKTLLICLALLLLIFLLFSCGNKGEAMSLPDDNTSVLQQDTITSNVTSDKAEETANSTGLEETTDTTEVIEEVEEVEEPVNESDTDTLSVPNDTTNTIK